jgi:cytochrome c oxidase subunit 4
MAHADAHADAHGEHGEGYLVHAHITPTKVYAGILGILILLTGLTVAAYRVRLGEWNLFVAVAIAAVKSSLVMAWFMHLKYEKKFNILIVLGSFVFMTIFLGYTLNDIAHRGRQGSMTGRRVDPMTGERARGTSILLMEDGEFSALPTVDHGEHGEDHEAHAGDGDDHEGHVDGDEHEDHEGHVDGDEHEDHEGHEDGDAHDDHEGGDAVEGDHE